MIVCLARAVSWTTISNLPAAQGSACVYSLESTGFTIHDVRAVDFSVRLGRRNRVYQGGCFKHRGCIHAVAACTPQLCDIYVVKERCTRPQGGFVRISRRSSLVRAFCCCDTGRLITRIGDQDLGKPNAQSKRLPENTGMAHQNLSARDGRTDLQTPSEAIIRFSSLIHI